MVQKSEASPTPPGYTDATTGYLKLGARYYNPTTGRFTQPDPSSQEANTYNYASCNPVNSTDPTGLVSEKCIGSLFAFAGVSAGTFAAILGTPFSLGGSAVIAGAGFTWIGAAITNDAICRTW